jgi:hypothetical protein
MTHADMLAYRCDPPNPQYIWYLAQKASAVTFVGGYREEFGSVGAAASPWEPIDGQVDGVDASALRDDGSPAGVWAEPPDASDSDSLGPELAPPSPP